MSKPCALFTTCSNLKTSDIIKLFLGDNELPACHSQEEGVLRYSWHIENKYYTADINICAIETRNIVSSEFAQLVEAFVVHFNPAESSSFEQVKCWLPFLKELNPGIQMLLCDRLTNSDAVSFADLQTWCVENTFELVELNPEETSEDDFPDVLGIERVRQGLQAHAWPNLVLREHPQIQSQYVRRLMQEINADNMEETNSPAGQVDSDLSNATNNSPLCENTTDTSLTDEEKLAQLHSNKHRDRTCQCMDSSLGDSHSNCSVSTERSNLSTERSNVNDTPGSCCAGNEYGSVGGECNNKIDTSAKVDSALANISSLSERKVERTSSNAGAQGERTSSNPGVQGADGDKPAADSAARIAGKSGGRKKKKKKQKSPASKKIATDESGVSSEDLALFAALGDEDSGQESFEMMFERLRLMKEKAATLPPEERKAHAEKTVLSFWKAIGGDEDEIDGLMDSDDSGP